MLCQRASLLMRRIGCPVATVGAALAPTAQQTPSAAAIAPSASAGLFGHSAPLVSSTGASAASHFVAAPAAAAAALRRFNTSAAVPSTSSSSHLQQQQQRSVVIETNETPNPDCLRFFSMELSFLPEGQSMDMPNDGHAYKSPLAEILFRLDGVKSLYFADEYITVTKEADADWAEVGTLVKEAIAQFAESGVSILSPEGEEEILPTNWDTDAADDDTEVVLAIKELLASRIRPMVQGDGGNVRFIGFDEDDGLVYVMLEGACKTCPSSGQTLKFGIERMLMHWIPEVTEVQEVDEEFAADYKRQQLEMIAKREKEDAAISSGCRR